MRDDDVGLSMRCLMLVLFLSFVSFFFLVIQSASHYKLYCITRMCNSHTWLLFSISLFLTNPPVSWNWTQLLTVKHIMTVSSNPKLDTFYRLYFLIHIPITVLVDSALVIPPAYRLAIQTKVLNFHISENKDFILLLAPSWLKVAGFVELIFQLPVFFIGIYALWNGKSSYIMRPIKLRW